MKEEKEVIYVPFESKAISEDDGNVKFEGLASTYEIDLGADKINPGAIKDTSAKAKSIAKERNSTKLWPVFFSHMSEMTVGKITYAKEMDKGLFVKGEMPLSDTYVKGRLYPQLKAGNIDSMSIGYRAIEKDYVGDIRHLNKIHLYEISLVSIPMNPGAILTGVKGMQYRLNWDDIDELSDKEIDAMLRAGTPATGRVSKRLTALLRSNARSKAGTLPDLPGEGGKSSGLDLEYTALIRALNA
jgi:HK97 family phage prohead protease